MIFEKEKLVSKEEVLAGIEKMNGFGVRTTGSGAQRDFVNYLKEIRMREAKKLLTETDMKIIEISQAVGYDNEKHFMKIFKRKTGVTALKYRKEKSMYDKTT